MSASQKFSGDIEIDKVESSVLPNILTTADLSTPQGCFHLYDMLLAKKGSDMRIGPGSTKKEVAKARKKIIMLYHPDRWPPEYKEKATFILQKVNNAWEVLSEHVPEPEEQPSTEDISESEEDRWEYTEESSDTGRYKSSGVDTTVAGPYTSSTEVSIADICFMCQGEIKPETSQFTCSCGNTYHQYCADRCTFCPSCGFKLNVLRANERKFDKIPFPKPSPSSVRSGFTADISQEDLSEKEVEEKGKRRRPVRKKDRSSRKGIAIASIAVVGLLIIAGIAAVLISNHNGNGTEDGVENMDRDGDGVANSEDAFPGDPSASVDTDKDGYPDEWNEGKTQSDSTTGLHLDAFPEEPSTSLDSDGDGWPDEWNENKTQSDSSTGLYLDDFPNDPSASVDTDHDGSPDQWNNGEIKENSTTGLHLDMFPDDPSASQDSDGDGWPNKWNDGMNISDSTTGLHLDVFPNDPAASIDTDGDAWPDEWNSGKSSSDSTSNPKLHLDAFPDEPEEWADSDGDGYGDNKADAFPNDPAASLDTDGDGYPDEWNEGKTQSDSTGLKLDAFPNNPTVWQDADGNGIADGYEQVNEITIANITFKFVSIPSGTFWLGSPSGEGSSDEHPYHQVTISKGFQMLKFEVTQSQWEAVMGSNPSHVYGVGDNKPVYYVSWNDAQSFVSQLNSLDSGHTCRLPTEVEWEYAARAGTDTKYSFGDDPAQLGQYAWYDDNSNGKTHPVGEKKPNPWGLYDMHGNVYEWVQDWYDSDYYSNSPGTDPQGPNSGSYRVLRGGSWFDFAPYCRSAYRYLSVPDLRDYSLGLRLVREASR